MRKILNLLKKTNIQIAIITLIVLISYVNILPNGLSFDDRDFFSDWPAIRNSETGLSAFLNLPDLLAGDLPVHHRGVYRPIRSVYYLLNLQIFGFNTFAFHLQSIIIHALVTLLVYLIARLITKNNLTAFISGIFFASHPIHTEAITYTAASFDTLGILFFFASFYFYLQANDETGSINLKASATKISQKTTRLLSWLLAFLAFFTYEMTLMLPFLIITYEVLLRGFSLKQLLKRFYIYLPYLMILGGYIATRVLLLHIGSRGDYLGPEYLPASNQAKLGIFEILFKYASLLILPINLTITYSVPDFAFSILYKITTNIDPSLYILNEIGKYIFLLPIILIFIICLLIFKIRHFKLVSFCLAWLIVSLVPVLNIVPQGAVIAERFLYIPSFGFCLLVGFLASTILQSNNLSPLKKNLFTLLIITAVLLFSLTTIVRNMDWHSQESLFYSAHLNDPSAFNPNAVLSLINIEKGNYDQSIYYSKQALALDPKSFEMYHRLGIALEKKGEYQTALENYQKALEIQNDFYYSNIQIGNIYLQQKKFPEALSEFEKAIKIEPNSYEAQFNRALILAQFKNYDLAIEGYQKALAINPYRSMTYNNLALVLNQKNDHQKAITYFKKALEIEPDNYYFNINLAETYETVHNPKEALNYYQKALKIKSGDASLINKINTLKQNY